MLVEVRKGKLIHIQPVEDIGGKNDRLWLGGTGRSAWRIIPSSMGKGKEIEQIQSHPNFDNPNWAEKDDFVVVYSTYRFEGREWHRISREQKDEWDNEGDWPERSRFP